MTTQGFAELLDALQWAMPGWASFDDPRLQWREIEYKREASEWANDVLSKNTMEQLIARGDWSEILKRLEAIGNKTNLLWLRIPQQGDLAVLYSDKLDKEGYTRQVYDLLYGPGDGDARFGRYLAYVETHQLPKEWPFPTYLLFLFHPATEFFIKPSVAQWFLGQIRKANEWETRPSVEAYQRIKQYVRLFGDFLSTYNPTDMIDLQSAIYMAKYEMERMNSPKVWWVNQGKAYKESRDGGFLWAPLETQSGRSVHHWESMAAARPGDIVLHYAEGALRAVSQVTEAATIRQRPSGLQDEKWQLEGRYVKTQYTYFKEPIPREAIVKHPEVRSIKYGPVMSNERVQLGYLFKFTKEALAKVVSSTNMDWPDYVRDFLGDLYEPAEPSDDTAPEQQKIRRAVRVSVPLSRWQENLEEGFISIGWGQVGDLRQFDSPEEIADAVSRYLGEEYSTERQRRSVAQQLWLFRTLERGDQVIATQGTSSILAVGRVKEPGYTWDRPDQGRGHMVAVDWDESRARRVGKQTHWRAAVVEEADSYLSGLAQSPGPGLPRPVLDLEAICQQFAAALRDSHIRFGPRHDEVVTAFVVSLATKPFVILTGLSGSGKTQLAVRFGEWLGPDRSRVVAVRPDWTGSEALFGYEDALQDPDEYGRRPWHVPDALAFMLKAARDTEHPYLLVLDEMNLAHVERYFADVLSGMESDQPVLPNLVKEKDGRWRLDPDGPERIPIPENLFVVGTVNVDETTYMFSPKVLDRANTIEFRVDSEDLSEGMRRPMPIQPGDPGLVRGFLAIATDPDGHLDQSQVDLTEFTRYLRALHRILSGSHVQFGHRVVYEANRFAALLAWAGVTDMMVALDLQVLQKVLPRVHGSRKRLEPVLRALGRFCFNPDVAGQEGTAAAFDFDPEEPPPGEPKLPRSFRKVQHMMRSLRADQFVSFAE